MNGALYSFNYCYLYGVVPLIKDPMPNSIEIADSIQLVTGKFFIVIDLNNVLFCSYFSTVTICIYLWEAPMYIN